MANEKSSYRDVTYLLDDPKSLRARADRDGYLFFRRLLEPRVLLELRRQILAVLMSKRLLVRDSDLMKGIADTSSPFEAFAGSGLPKDVYLEVQRMELFHRIPHHERLLRVFDALLDSEVLIHPGLIGRIIVPHALYKPIPPHQDFVHVKGSSRAWTCWIPLGNISKELGGLSVLRGSNRNGVYPTRPKENGGFEAIIDESENNDWVVGDFEIGDVVLFSGLTVHKAEPHIKTEKVRLSMDFRFQPRSECITANSLQPHGKIAEWGEIYESWENLELQYYFDKMNLLVVN